MIREIIRPKDTNLTINIPEEYVGKRVEYIIFPLENDEKDKDNNIKSISSLKGALQQYADPSRIELEDQAWKLHIQKKYKIND